MVNQGWDSEKLTVRSSIFSTVSFSPNMPAWNGMLSPTSSGWLYSDSNGKIMSSTVSGSPSDQRAPSRILSVRVRPPSLQRYHSPYLGSRPPPPMPPPSA